MPQTFIQRTAGQSIGLQLGQVRPAVTTAVSLYTPADGVLTKVEKIVVANTTATAAVCNIFHDEDGTTYDQSTSLYYGKTVVGNDSLIFEVDAYMNNMNGSIGVETDTVSALTFTAYGTEIRTRAR